MATVIKRSPVVTNKTASAAFKRAVQEKSDRMKANTPPPETMKFIKQKAEETSKLNGEGFNKQDFILGCVAMWAHMTHKTKPQ